MKKLLCVVPVLLLFAMIGAPDARADSYIPTFSCEQVPNHACFGPPTAPSASFPGPTDMTVAFKYFPTSVSPFTINLSASDGPTDTYLWSYGSNQYPIQGLYVGGFSITDLTTGLEDRVSFSSTSPLPYIDDVSQGPLIFTPATTATPEPASIMLMLLGVGLIVFMRKRFIMRISRTAQTF
jgi:hypothetical protein